MHVNVGAGNFGSQIPEHHAVAAGIITVMMDIAKGGGMLLQELN